MNKRKLLFRDVLLMVVAVLTLIYVVGCSSSTKKNTAIVLKSTKDALIATMSSVIRLHDQGIIGEEDYQVASEAYDHARLLLLQAKRVRDRMISMDSYNEIDIYNDLLWEVAGMAEIIETIMWKGD